MLTGSMQLRENYAASSDYSITYVAVSEDER